MSQEMDPEVSVIVVSFNTREMLGECLNTLAAQAGGVRYEVIVVDNASRDGSADLVERDFPDAKLIRSDVNLGFGAANTRGFQVARSKYVVLLNSDAFLKPGALPIAVEKMRSSPKVGLAGGLLVGRDGSRQPSARKFPTVVDELLILSGLAARYPRSRFFGRFDRTWADPNLAAPVDWVPGAFSIIRRDVLEQIGYFDENFFLYYEEVDLCRRIKQAGHEIWYWPDVVVVHIGGESSRTLEGMTMSSSGSQLTLWRMRSALLYYRKHHGLGCAWLAKQLEFCWHRLRAIKNARSADPARKAKAQDSQTIANLMTRAWRETHGGRVSPNRPW